MPQGLNLSGKWQVELILFLCLHFKQANMTVFWKWWTFSVWMDEVRWIEGLLKGLLTKQGSNMVSVTTAHVLKGHSRHFPWTLDL